jgi:transcriptional regulator with XRE-family HTH domain
VFAFNALSIQIKIYGKRDVKDRIFNSDRSFAAFGRYLKSLREQMGIPIEAVARNLRISAHHLLVIESEDHEKLPDAARVRGILKAYAGYIGVDADDIIERYRISRAAYEEKLPKISFFKRHAKPFFRAGTVLGLFIIVIVISTYMVYGAFFGTGESIGSGLCGDDPKQMEKFSLSVPAETESAENAPCDGVPEKLFLQIDVVEDTDLKIIVDNSDPVKYSLHPMDHIELEAASGIHMLLDNAGGVEIMLNGRPVDIPAKSGEYVTIKLP